MSSEKLIRWAGLAGIVTGILGGVPPVVVWALFRDEPTRLAATSSIFFIMVILNLLGNYLSVIALVGLYGRQTKESGRLGLISFIIASIGSGLGIGLMWANAFMVPSLAASAPEFLDMIDASPPGMVAAGLISTVVLVSLGWALAGIAWLRAKILPSPPVWLVIVGAILFLALGPTGLPIGAVVFGLGVSWLGWWLWSEKRT